MILAGLLKLQIRSYGITVATCPQFLKSGEDAEVYGSFSTAWTYENGGWTDTGAIDYAVDDGVEACPTATYDSSYDSEFDYGAFVSSETTFSDPTTRGTLLSAIAALSDTWSSWSDAGLSWGGNDAASLFGDLTATYDLAPGEGYLGIGGVIDDGGGFGHLEGFKSAAELKFVLQMPLACVVVYQIGTRYLPAYGGADPDPDYTWGGEVELTVSSEATVALPVTEDYATKLRIVRVRWHPWA